MIIEFINGLLLRNLMRRSMQRWPKLASLLEGGYRPQKIGAPLGQAVVNYYDYGNAPTELNN